MKYLRWCLVFLLLCLCGCFRTESEGTQQKEIETVTKTIEVRQEYNDGQVMELTTQTYESTVSKEQATWETQKNTTVSPPSVGGFLGSITTGNPVIDGGIAILTGLLGKKGYDKIRDANPRTPQPAQAPQQKIVRREEED